jgi:hypothetical protein
VVEVIGDEPWLCCIIINLYNLCLHKRVVNGKKYFRKVGVVNLWQNFLSANLFTRIKKRFSALIVTWMGSVGHIAQTGKFIQ